LPDEAKTCRILQDKNADTLVLPDLADGLRDASKAVIGHPRFIFTRVDLRDSLYKPGGALSGGRHSLYS